MWPGARDGQCGRVMVLLDCNLICERLCASVLTSCLCVFGRIASLMCETFARDAKRISSGSPFEVTFVTQTLILRAVSTEAE